MLASFLSPLSPDIWNLFHFWHHILVRASGLPEYPTCSFPRIRRRDKACLSVGRPAGILKKQIFSLRLWWKNTRGPQFFEQKHEQVPWHMEKKHRHIHEMNFWIRFETPWTLLPLPGDEVPIPKSWDSILPIHRCISLYLQFCAYGSNPPPSYYIELHPI